MRVALIAPPFIPVPPRSYGGTELFLAQLAQGLRSHGVEPVVYANGESRLDVEVRSLYPRSHWPLRGELSETLKDLNHSSWAVHDAMNSCDIIHLNSAPGLALARFIPQPTVYTVHHAQDDNLVEFYRSFSKTHFVAISEFQRKQQKLTNSRTIHHGLDMSQYVAPPDSKREYFIFLGRIAPVKGTHLAIEVARKTGIPLKIAGEVQPMFQQYFETQIKPHIDGRLVEFVGEVGLKEKNELLGSALALLFPIQWNEPFGLVMTESMACGAPVIALRGGSVDEVVKHGESGFVCASVDEMVATAKQLPLDPGRVRQYAETHFSSDVMVQKYVELYRSIADDRQTAEVSAVA